MTSRTADAIEQAARVLRRRATWYELAALASRIDPGARIKARHYAHMTGSPTKVTTAA